eukprot:TRINITY_DN9348_c0_g1_i12.p1 TRINITY_DN9348_c0_g1~~TRINITY_DN9348_c0_g1_i12.p1  ORF type:complete len:333 (-),score=63.75 TRINITY_DN9348_c0_g1_i12:385-1383(-)
MKEFSVTSLDGLVSDQTTINRKGIFIEEKPRGNAGTSLLTQALQQRSLSTSSRSLGCIEAVDPSDPNYHTVKVYILETAQEITVEASKENTVEELIKHAYLTCLRMEKDEIQLPHKTSEGYELRLAYDGQPIYEMSPLDRAKTLGEYELDSAAFCARKDFKKRRGSGRGCSIRSVARPGMVKLKVHVHANREKVALCIQSEPTQLLEDLFEKIAAKRGLRRSNLYKFMEYSEVFNYEENISTLLRYSDDMNIRILDMKTPIGKLKVSEVVLFERYFPDIPDGFSQLKASFTTDTRTSSAQKQKTVCEDQFSANADSYSEYYVGICCDDRSLM